MLYRNKINGAVIDISSTIMSDTWEPVEKQAPVVVVPTAEAVEEKVEVAPVQPKTTRKKKTEK